MRAPAQSPMRRPAFLTLILFPLSMIRVLLQGILVSKPYRNLILRLVRRSGGPLPTTQWPPSSPSVVQMILQRLWLASERARLKLLLKSRAEMLQQRRESIKTRQKQLQRLATSSKGRRPRRASNRSKTIGREHVREGRRVSESEATGGRP